ncbi:ras-related protein Rab-35-like isoform X1 [Haliotis asinina]|uniref:ras-related protein Rab-35-like isoform X1 n=1 Tax=Haliotis asinina TaxID=109174 RepID=UPI003531A066
MASDRYPMFKLVLLGEPGVGKSSLFFRAKDNTFHEGHRSTIGIDSCTRIVQTKREKVKLSLWDTAGVERFRTLTRNYYRNTHAVVLMYDVNSPHTLSYLSKWSHDSTDFAPTALKFLVGNKTDLESYVDKKSVHNFGMGHSCDSAYLISAKTGDGVEEAISSIGVKLLKGYRESEMTQSWLQDDNLPKPDSKSSCCS